MAGSVTSLGLPETINATTGVPLPEEIIAMLADGGILEANNPHMAYSNSERRGYAVVEATGDELDVRFRSPATTTAPESTVSTLEHMVVAAGTPAVEIA